MVDEVMADRRANTREAPDAVLVHDLVVAVFEGANVPNDRNRPAHAMIRFLMESIFVSRPIAGHRR